MCKILIKFLKTKLVDLSDSLQVKTLSDLKIVLKEKITIKLLIS